MAVKPFPACHFAHAFADAAIALKDKVSVKEVEKVTALVTIPAGHKLAVRDIELDGLQTANGYEFAPYLAHYGTFDGHRQASCVELAASRLHGVPKVL